MSLQSITIVLWGTPKKTGDWIDWYERIKELSNKIGHPITHLGIKSESNTSSKIVTVSRKEKQLIETIKSGEKIDSLSCLSLPKDYQIASFDFDVFFVRNASYVAVTIKDEYYTSTIEADIISTISDYVENYEGEIFSTSIKEVPLIYVATKEKSNLSTYNLIKSIEGK
ncbi:hypothetical protein [Butyrivibrio sp. INlla21]|uniref:hypothetical protein n=1 Tax=Butyrivibrio sp. INlla21 TaxID=1520811 RepID=UPI0008E6642B|nr:hypothetical protein [Butyrivibrio sp. INlla21]SFU79868.1 hypothetical protein SAMN02910342_01797 [Butyrivibrio sp. INlla21]